MIPPNTPNMVINWFLKSRQSAICHSIVVGKVEPDNPETRLGKTKPNCKIFENFMFDVLFDVYLAPKPDRLQNVHEFNSQSKMENSK